MDNTDQIQRLAAGFKSRRKQLGLTQFDLAELAGVSPRFIHDLENGKPTVQLTKLMAVATTLGYELTLQKRRPEQR